MRLDNQGAFAGICRRGLLFFLTLTVLGSSGCGSALYEERLGRTRLLFAHIDLLNDNLQSKWADPQTGAALRPPLQFTVMAGPEKPQPAPGEAPKEEEEDIPDPRQPGYLNVELPGLRGGFQAKVKVIGDNNVEVVDDAWMYVLTNHDMYEQVDQAKEFNKSVVKTLAAAIEPSDATEYETVSFPSKQGTFVKPVKYTTVTLTPKADIAGLARQFIFYMYEQGDLQLTVLFVLPQNTDSSEKLIERIALCLETLELAGNNLVRPGPGGVVAPPSGAGF